MKPIRLLATFLALTGACAEAADEPRPEDALVQAILSANWTWEAVASGKGRVEDLRFYRGGFTENVQFWTGRWSVAGPRTLVIENTRPGARHFGRKAYLVFNAALTHFTGFDFNGKTTVEGVRREAVDPHRAPPEASDPPPPRRRSAPAATEEKPPSPAKAPERNVVVRGASVRAPGEIPWREGMTLLEVLIRSGASVDFAPEVRVIRGTDTLRFSPRKLIRHSLPDPALQPGDLIEVP